MSVKEMVLSALQRLPDDVEFKDIAEEIAFLSAVREGQDDLSCGRVISNEEMKKRIDSWIGV
jgi:predicted transcriptional regulator